MKAKILLLSLVAMLQLRCGDDNSLSIDQKVNSSAWVTIVDNQANPMKNVKITIDDLHGLTDVDGHFLLRNVSISSNAYLKAEKSGFFTGSRRFYPVSGHIDYIYIMLLAYEEKGVFNIADGGIVNVDQKSSLLFPANAVSRADSSPYLGLVHVMAAPLNVDDPDISDKMPGDLSGTDASGRTVILGSFGMMAVELQDDNGMKLQVTPGKSIEMKIGIAQEMLNTAPSTIPLWFFDPDNGIWKEDGVAEKIGNQYVGDVNHFSTWNVDFSMERIKWDATFVYESGQPVAGYEIRVKIKNLNSSSHGRTNDAGKVSGYIPLNEPLILEVEDLCGKVFYSKEIGPYNGDHSEGVIGLSDITTTTISGKALDCSDHGVSDGHVLFNVDGFNYVFNLKDANGLFEHQLPVCHFDVATVTVVDEKRGMSSLPLTFHVSSQTKLGNLKVCDSLDQYVRFRVKGFNQEYVYYFFNTSVYNDPGYTNTSIQSIDTIGHSGTFGFGFAGVSTGTYANVQTGSRVNLPNGEYGYVINLNVNVTYFGDKGDFIKGNFAGKITAGSNGAGGHGYSDFDGTFAVRRNP